MPERASNRNDRDHRTVPPVELLYIRDIASIRRTTESAARRAVLRGECGPYLRVGRRLAVRADAFREALEAAETHPKPPHRPSSRPSAERWTRGLLNPDRVR